MSDVRSGPSIRLVLVDTNPVFREHLRGALAGEPDLALVGEATRLSPALRLVARHRPHVAMVDLDVAEGIGGRDLPAKAPDCRMLLLIPDTLRDPTARVVATGANGYERRAAPHRQLVRAIRTIARGEKYFSPEDVPVHPAAPRNELARLSRREREVFELIVRGLPNVALATRLHISVKTVESHRASINRKLDVHSSADAVRYFIRTASASTGLMGREVSSVPSAERWPNTLSRREREVFSLVVGGLTNAKIAQRLFISVRTVETHRANINRKLDLHSSADAVRFAAAHSLLD